MTRKANSAIYRVLSYNIHKGFSTANRRFVLHELKNKVEKTHADLLLLQEVQGEHSEKSKQHDNWPTNSQFEFLADRMWNHYSYAKNAVYDEGHHGNAVLSKFPIETSENVNVSKLRWASRSILHCQIAVPQLPEPLHAICVHFGLFENERSAQTQKLVSYIREKIPDSAPMILGGDFNDWNRKVEALLQKELGLRDAFMCLTGSHAKSFPSYFPVLALDRIYFRNLNPLACAIVKSEKKNRLSDHLCLSVDFELK